MWRSASGLCGAWARAKTDARCRVSAVAKAMQFRESAGFAISEKCMKSEPPKRPSVLIFMGVAGSGKTTVAALFAEKTGAVFYEGDDFHPPENVAKMSAGIPLTDADRAPWLRELRKIILRALVSETFSVLTCSALKASYRETLSAADPRVGFVHLTGPRA